ncbi:MAG: chorismate synthase [Bacillota bacterium]
MLRYLTAGESHGRGLVALVEGLPAGLPVDLAAINEQLHRRQQGYGRGGRMRIEKDQAEILSGVRHGETLGGPVALAVWNRDWDNWTEVMSPEVLPEPPARPRTVTRPRPGHADLAGALKYDRTDARDILERSSARETAARVAAGTLARLLLRQAGAEVYSHVVRIGSVAVPESAAGTDRQEGPGDPDGPRPPQALPPEGPLPPAELAARAEASPVRCADLATSQAMVQAIDEAKARGTSLGGIAEVLVTGLPPGLGSHVSWDRKLDGLLAQALMSIQSVKGVEVGLGFAAAALPGDQVHDAIYYEEGRGYYRRTNRAGGLEGGMTNGETLVVRAAFKPIATQYRPLATVDLATHQAVEASVERSDTCAVPAGAVIAEAVVAFALAQAYLEKFGGDSLEEFLRNLNAYRGRLEER